ncbi:uncharacterized protein LOC100901732 [Galendromus occidentalis]|uniref:Uncharacterized protein LOC100901732 n=1 Tax=Galendromus occidentalis TaxID=34638 RepID=A0AAJ6QTT0_9ACAR|nr:uncharacterized protein LOC100901732 [Galendromus occidentalis]
MMKNGFVGPANAQIPPLGDLPKSLTVNRKDVQAYDLNPFSFYVNYDTNKLRNVDLKAQEFGQRFKKDDHAEEPQRWALVSLEDRWYRAEVLEKYYNRDGECYRAECCLIDTGRKLLVDIERIFPMPAEVLTAGPAQSLRVFPKNVAECNRQLFELFECYPEVKFRVEFEENLSKSCKSKPHLVGSTAEVFVGNQEWMSLVALLQTSFIEVDENSVGDSRNQKGLASRVDGRSLESESEADYPESDDTERDGGATVRRRESPSPGEYVETQQIVDLVLDASGDGATARSTSSLVVAAVQRQAAVSGPRIMDSDDDSSSGGDNKVPGPESDEHVANISYIPRDQKILTDVEGENQGAMMTQRSYENAKQVAKRNEFRDRFCRNFLRTGECLEGQHCPHLHEVPLEKALTATGHTVDFQDFRDIDLKGIDVGFGVCTHVDESGCVHLVLPYGALSIWGVLECKGNLELEFRQISRELPALYDHQMGNKNKVDPNGDVAVVWVEKPDSGRLRNVCQGWYRAKILKREQKSYKVYLVDHGAELSIEKEHVYPLAKSLLSFPKQSIRCQLQGTKLIGNESAMLDMLKGHIIIFKLYEYSVKDNLHKVELFKKTEDVSIHYGEELVKRGILARADTP